MQKVGFKLSIKQFDFAFIFEMKVNNKNMLAKNDNL